MLFTSCDLFNSDDEGIDTVLSPGENAQEEVQAALNDVSDGAVIVFESGRFDFRKILTMDAKSNVTIRGQGRSKTILDFQGQLSGGDGMLITNSDNIVV